MFGGFACGVPLDCKARRNVDALWAGRPSSETAACACCPDYWWAGCEHAVLAGRPSVTSGLLPRCLAHPPAPAGCRRYQACDRPANQLREGASPSGARPARRLRPLGAQSFRDAVWIPLAIERRRRRAHPLPPGNSGASSWVRVPRRSLDPQPARTRDRPQADERACWASARADL